MFYNWYLRGLFEGDEHQREKYKNIDPTAIADSQLLDMICEITGMTELQVIEHACEEVKKRRPRFFWEFGDYFKDLKLELHPLIREELRKAYFVLHNQ